MTGWRLAWLGMALAAAGRAQQTDPILKLSEPGVSLVSETEPLKATVTGGSTNPPPVFLGTPPWFRTGERQFTWHFVVTEPVEGGMGPMHPLDGLVTTANTLDIPMDQPGSFTLWVTMQEEWQDSSDPPNYLFWPQSVRKSSNPDDDND